VGNNASTYKHKEPASVATNDAASACLFSPVADLNDTTITVFHKSFCL